MAKLYYKNDIKGIFKDFSWHILPLPTKISKENNPPSSSRFRFPIQLQFFPNNYDYNIEFKTK